MRNEDIGTDNGSAIIEPGDPVAANSPGWWTITYTAGPRGIDVGGSVRFEIPYGFTPPQPHWHGDIGHVSATCSREGVELRITVEEPPVRRDPESFYYVTRWGRHLFVQVLGEPLVEGDTITLVYGRHPGFQAGAFAQHFAGPAEFTVATDVDGTRSAKFSGYTLIAEQPVLEVIAAEPDHFEVYAPTLAVTGEPIELTILARDNEANTVPPGKGVVEFASNEAGAEVQLVDASPMSRRARVVFHTPGRKVVRVIDVAGALTGVSNPVIVSDEPPELNLFWGDIHGHTILSDGLKTPEQYYAFGRDEAALDFCAIADHSQYMSDEDWEHIMRATRQFNTPGEYVTLLGYELSVNASDREEYGDKNLYYPGDEGPLLRATDINRSSYCYISEFVDEWKSHGAMMILHQHAHGSGTFYDPDLVRLCEVYSIWGCSESLDCTRPLMPARDRDYTGHLGADLLAKGWRLGFMAASDDHAGRPGKTDWLRVRRAYPGGLAAVFAPELTREAIWEALWNRRCYGTSGARIYLDFRVDGALMGSVLDASHTEPEIEVTVVGTEPVVLIEVLRGSEVIRRHTGIAEEAHLVFTDDDLPAAGAYYYVRVTQADDEMAWSSPIWIES
ncbi:MAG: DUF3604 domain-containing protein [Armatimonadetes bacterium]|nr:DUF3604 domain-containing protein [Armatimonadota bacterium]